MSNCSRRQGYIGAMTKRFLIPECRRGWLAQLARNDSVPIREPQRGRLFKRSGHLSSCQPGAARIRDLLKMRDQVCRLATRRPSASSFWTVKYKIEMLFG